ncbi:hypothetical protein LSH36_379g00037 [Paralvinella palmiformis]|uniref:Uncharacterized protein n=1 Tax=Paralvinella palmiformis TaxID=53620 RepID=A0AAD9JDA1_9ANNE|nr:hypothetical protein LSH36_379g00037 [Paralvinella palmiformis]
MPTLGGIPCPVTANFTKRCTCNMWQLKCSLLGNNDEFPDLFNDTTKHIFANVTISSSKIITLQTRAISALRTREMFFVGIEIEVIEDEAFVNQSDVLEALYLSYNAIRIIKPRAFSGLVRLIRLKLDNNRLIEIDGSLFRGMPALSNLYLHANILESLRSNTFPSGLETLTLYRNRLQTLPADVFNQRNLTLLNLRENNFTNLTDKLFHSLPSLMNLDLSWNRLTSIGKNVFAGSLRLRHLDFAINNIEAVHPKAFEKLGELQFLDLSDNRLSEIPGPLFANLSDLRTLYISSNQLAGLPDQMSSGMRKLKTLHLHSNRLGSIGRTPLSNLVLLEELTLDHNRIAAIEFGAFDFLGKLRRLDLSHNSLGRLFDEPFASSVDLEWLDLSYNDLTEIPASYFRNLEGLVFVDVSNNRVWNLSKDSFVSQTEMRYLNLSSNWLQNVQPGSFASNGNVAFLSLASNPLLALDGDTFKGMASLDTLLMNNTCFAELPGSLFRDAPAIRRIELENGHIVSVRNETFSGLDKLRYLDLSHNRIRTVESGAFAAPNIRTLKLANNNINIYGLRAATSLFSPTVSHLDVSYNNVTALTGITPRLFDEIDEVLFAGNPFTCDCESDIFWIRNLHTLRDFETVACSSPPDKVNMKVVCFDDDCQNSSYSAYPFQFTCDRNPFVDENAAVAAGMTGTVFRQLYDVCDMTRYTTIKTPTPTAMTTPKTLQTADMRISVILRTISVRETTGILVRWNVTESLRSIAKGYAISTEAQSRTASQIFIMDPASSNYSLNDLDPDTDFRICVRALLGVKNAGVVDADCAHLRTSTSTSIENSPLLIIVLAVVSVVCVIVVIVIVVGVCLRRQKKRTGPKEVGKNKKSTSSSMSTSPQAWVAPDVTLVGDRNDVGRKSVVDEESDHVTDLTDIWMDDDGEINFGGAVWEEVEVTRLSQSLGAIDQQTEKGRKKSAAVSQPKRSNSTLANAGRWAASFNNNTGRGGGGSGDGVGADDIEEQMGEQTMLSLNIFDCKNGKMDGARTGGFGK